MVKVRLQGTTCEIKRTKRCIERNKRIKVISVSDAFPNTLDMCMENGLKSVAFCCISTGVFHFPNKRAAEIAVETVQEWLREHRGYMERVIFNVFKDEDKDIYERLLS